MWQMSNPREVGDRMLCGGQPTALDFERCKALGFSTVVNLRPDMEMMACGIDEPAMLRQLGLDYEVIPVASPTDLNEGNARRLGEVIDAASGKVLIHCGSGNRVGALLAVHAARVAHQSPEQALALGRQAGLTALEPVVASLLAQG
jgi:uncharacterized protein (TIGR01244 family)